MQRFTSVCLCPDSPRARRKGVSCEWTPGEETDSRILASMSFPPSIVHLINPLSFSGSLTDPNQPNLLGSLQGLSEKTMYKGLKSVPDIEYGQLLLLVGTSSDAIKIKSDM